MKHGMSSLNKATKTEVLVVGAVHKFLCIVTSDLVDESEKIQVCR